MRSSLAAAVLVVAMPAAAGAQRVVPNQMHRSFAFSLHSVKDEVLLYEGDPQNLLQILVQPSNTLFPRVDFSNANQAVVLQLRDLTLLEPSEVDSIQAAEDAELGIDHDAPKPAPKSQVWEVQLAPASPGEYILQCDGGKARFDFTDLPVREVHVLADTTDVRAEFKRPNPIELVRFKLTARAGRVDIRGFMNARPKSASLQLDDSECEIDLTGKPFDGTAELFFEGVPKKLKLLLPTNAAVHVEGPSTVVARFDRDGMKVAGLGLETADFASHRCRLRLYFSRPVPKLEIEWGG